MYKSRKVLCIIEHLSEAQNMFCCFCAVTLTITVASNDEALIPLSGENYKKVTLLLILALLLKVRITEMCFKVMLNYCIVYYFALILHCKCTVHYLCFMIDRRHVQGVLRIIL